MKILAIALAFVFLAGVAHADSVLNCARQEIGHGEQGGNNKGIYVRKYLNGQEGLPWCAGFVSWCVREAGYDIPYLLRAKSYLKYGQKIERWALQPGDLVIFSRKGGGHIGIIERIVNNGFISIEGNTGAYPSRVKRINHMFQDENIIGFVRIR